MADSKLLKTLTKIAGQLTHLKDVIAISEPCAPARYPRPPAAAAPPMLPPLCRPPCCLLLHPVRLPSARVNMARKPNSQLTQAGQACVGVRYINILR